MKKIKIVVISVIFMISGFILGACGNTVIAEQTHPLKIWSENRNGQMETWKVVDEDTGVNYIVVAPNYSEYGNIRMFPYHDWWKFIKYNIKDRHKCPFKTFLIAGKF